MPTKETLFFHGTLYTWHHEKQNEYENRHITIYDAVLAVEDDKTCTVIQDEFEPERYKHIGKYQHRLIFVNN